MKTKKIKVLKANLYHLKESDKRLKDNLNLLEEYDLSILKDQLKSGRKFKPLKIKEYLKVKKSGTPILNFLRSNTTETVCDLLEVDGEKNEYMLGLVLKEGVIASKVKLEVDENGELYALFEDPLKVVVSILAFLPPNDLFVFTGQSDGFTFLKEETETVLADWFNINFEKLKKDIKKAEKIVKFISEALKISYDEELKTLAMVEVWFPKALESIPMFKFLKDYENKYPNFAIHILTPEDKKNLLYTKKLLRKKGRIPKEILNPEELFEKIFNIRNKENQN